MVLEETTLDLRRVPFSLRHGLWDRDQYLFLLERRIEALKWMKANNVERLK